MNQYMSSGYTQILKRVCISYLYHIMPITNVFSSLVHFSFHLQSSVFPVFDDFRNVKLNPWKYFIRKKCLICISINLINVETIK